MFSTTFVLADSETPFHSDVEGSPASKQSSCTAAASRRIEEETTYGVPGSDAATFGASGVCETGHLQNAKFYFGAITEILFWRKNVAIRGSMRALG